MNTPRMEPPSPTTANSSNSVSQGFDVAQENPEEDQTTTTLQIAQDRVTQFIVKELYVKLQYGHSQAELEHHLRNASDLLGEDIATSWSAVMKLLRNLGYSEPSHYKVCVSSDHSVVLGSKASACHMCSKLREDCIDYYVLGMGFTDWFCTDERCDQLMSHWEDKDNWLYGSVTGVNRTELWHGERFQELSYFWDPTQTTMLPQKCTSCSGIIPSSVMKDLAQQDSERISLTCPKCKAKVTIIATFMRGDPRNQAIMIHEDGWASHSTSSKHSVAAITITKACMNKLNRSYNKNAQVYSFIPTDQLPQKSPHKFDAFFDPLIDEIEELYINGTEVFFKSAVVGHSPANDTAILRVVPLLFTADLRAHAEIGLSSAGGRKGCRRCEVIGTYVPTSNHYYYGNFLERYRQPSLPRTTQSNRLYATAVDGAATETERKRLARECGVTGETVLYRLHDLCGFDTVKDMVIDAMHAVSLNLLRSELEKHLLMDLGANSSITAVERDPSFGGLLSRNDLSQSLKKVAWPTEYKDGRVPTVCPSEPTGHHKLGFWKCEDFNKFAIVAPYVLHSIIPKPAYDCIILLSRIHGLIFSKRLRVTGWTQEHIELLRSLMWKHAIMLESLYGITACTENVECSLHMAEDVQRHSTLDNYWCFVYERLVKYYKNQTSNMKQLCKTFATRASQLRFVNVYLETSRLDRQEQQTLPASVAILEAKTEEQAIRLKEDLSIKYSAMSNQQKKQYDSGILLGCSKHFMLSSRQKSDVLYWIRRETVAPLDTQELGNMAYSYSRVLKANDIDQATVYREGEHVIIQDSEVENREWVIRVTKIFVYGPVSGIYYPFIDGDYYVAKSCRGEVQYDPWTRQPLMIPRAFSKLCVQPLRTISRKVIMYPMPQHSTSPSYYLTVDLDDIPKLESCFIPYPARCGDIVQVDGQIILVHNINHRTGKGKKLRKIRGKTNKWTATDSVVEFSLLSVEKNIQFEENIGIFTVTI